MLGDLSQVEKIYLRAGYTDMRKQLDGLVDIIQYSFQLDNSLFLLESCADPDANEPALVEVEKHLRKRKYAGQREKLIKNIPHIKVLHTIDESKQICERCGGAMVKVGEEFVRTEV